MLRLQELVLKVVTNCLEMMVHVLQHSESYLIHLSAQHQFHSEQHQFQYSRTD